MLNNYPMIDTSKPARPGSYAGFPGTGPAGEVCSRCRLQTADRAKFYCSKFQTLTGRRGSAISPGSPACRYFEARPAFNSSPAE